MDLSKLAQRLGLPAESNEATVFEALAKRDAEGRAAVETLSTLAGELPKHGFQLSGKVLSRLAPVSLDISPKEGDDEEKLALKKRLAAAEEAANLARLAENKAFVTKLSADMKLPPALMSTVEEVLGVRGEMEALALSKDGKVELRRSKDFGTTVRTLLEALSSMKGGPKFKTETKEAKPESEQDAETREKAALEVSKRVGGSKSEELSKEVVKS
jgi:hypothetical protein